MISNRDVYLFIQIQESSRKAKSVDIHNCCYDDLFPL
jgi:hypothetical protein